MRIKILLMAVVLAGLLFSLSASAQNGAVCDDPVTTDPSCGSIPFDRQLSYTDNVAVDKFDQTLGELLEVRMTARACGRVTAELDSEDQTAQEFTIIALARVIPNLPNIGEEIFQIELDETFNVAADDEPGPDNANFAGPDYSGILAIGTQANPECTAEREYIFTGTQMDPFKGIGEEELQIVVTTQSAITVIGSVLQESRSSAFMGIEICVEYVYCPPEELFCINGTKTNACTDEGIEDWEICLTKPDGSEVCIPTDENGDYSFCGLEPGDYVVCETPQAGYKPVEPTCIAVPLTDANVEDVNFENEPPFCISGHKFNDTTDEGLGGWTINLLDASGAVIDTTTTQDETGDIGYYEFCGLFSGTYTVCEVLKSGWTAVGPTCREVILDCADETDIDFRNKPTPPPICGGCPWYLNNDAYRTQCGVILDVDASQGILSNDREGAKVIDPDLITIDSKYGSLKVEEDGSFVFEPALKYPRGTTTVSFNYRATNEFCDANGQATAKISVTCR